MSEKTKNNENLEAKGEEKPDYNAMVPYMVPRDNSSKKSKTLTLSLNGKSIVVPRGELVQMPLKYKLLLEKKDRLRDMDDSYKDELTAQMEAANNQLK